VRIPGSIIPYKISARRFTITKKAAVTSTLPITTGKSNFSKASTVTFPIPLPAKNILHKECAGQQFCKPPGNSSNYRVKCIAQSMLKEHRFFTEPICISGAYKILVKRIKHGASGKLCYNRKWPYTQYNCRKNRFCNCSCLPLKASYPYKLPVMCRPAKPLRTKQKNAYQHNAHKK